MLDASHILQSDIFQFHYGKVFDECERKIPRLLAGMIGFLMLIIRWLCSCFHGM